MLKASNILLIISVLLLVLDAVMMAAQIPNPKSPVWLELTLPDKLGYARLGHPAVLSSSSNIILLKKVNPKF